MKRIGWLSALVVMFCMACEDKIQKTEVRVIDQFDSIELSYGPKENPVKQALPKEIRLDELKATEFMPTLENKLSGSLNSIYSPTLLFAWQEIKDYCRSPVELSNRNSPDFKLLNQSRSFQNSLNKDEYTTTITFGDVIEARAEFKKMLPFKLPFHTQEEPMKFNGSNVRTFGLNYPDAELYDYFQILYYQDEDHFAIKLLPADSTSEIILVKGINLSGTFADLLTSTNKWISKGDKERMIKEKAWRYGFGDADHLSIPTMKFNIGTNYKTLEGQTFTSNAMPYQIIKAYQRTAFVFDEYGAIIESQTVIACDTTAIAPEPIEKPVPKKMLFDKPYFIFVKKKNSPNPYFAMRVMNAELMEKK